MVGKSTFICLSSCYKYPYQSEQYVELSQSELDQLQPDDDKTIHVEHFLKPSFVDPVVWDDYKDDAEHRLTKLVESRIAAAQRPRPSRSNGRRRSGNGRPRSRAKTPATNGSSPGRRKAA